MSEVTMTSVQSTVIDINVPLQYISTEFGGTVLYFAFLLPYAVPPFDLVLFTQA